MVKYYLKSLINKNSILYSIKNASFFLIVAFINAFMPIALCIASSFINPYGAQVVMGVGYVAAFLLTFSQVGISFATSVYFLIKNRTKKEHLNKQETENSIMSRGILISLLMGVFLCIIYCISSYLYIKFSCDRPNTIQTLDYGIQFIYSSFVYVLLICLNFLLMLYIKIRNRRLATILQISSMIFIVVFASILGVHTNLGAIGIGLGCSIGSFLILIISSLIIIFKYPIQIKKIYFKYRSNKKDIKDMLSETTAGVSVSFFKGIAILILGLALPAKLGAFVPLSYQMARLIWFNIMYSVVWFAIGLSDTIKFYTLNDDGSWNKKTKIMWFNKLLLLSFIVTLIFCIGAWFLIEPLAKLYIQNGTYASFLEKPKFTELEQLLNNMYTQADAIFNKHISGLSTATDINEKIKIINAWIESNYNTFFGRIKILNLIRDLAQNISINPKDIETFVNCIVEYRGFTSYNAEIIVALLNHQFKSPDFLISLGLQNYNSNASFYIFIYALLCSIWTILMPASKAIIGKGLNDFFVATVYAVALAFIIYFGVYYSLIDNKVGNTFRFLDAWTFPLAIVSVVVFSFIFTKWMVIIFKVYYYDKASINYWKRKIKFYYRGLDYNQIKALSALKLHNDLSANILKEKYNIEITNSNFQYLIDEELVKFEKKNQTYFYHLGESIKNII